MLKKLLEQILIDFPPINRINNDPIQFPRKLYDEGRSLCEVEAAAVFSAMLAYGSAAQFTKKIQEAMNACDWQFLDFMQSKGRFSDQSKYKWPMYRMSKSEEIAVFVHAVGKVIEKNGSLKKVFLSGYLPEHNLQNGLIKLHECITQAAEEEQKPLSHGIKHLLPDPASGGCAKRWHMFLRWMIRKDDGVDMGLWPECRQSDLLIPVDRHISQIARHLGLTSRATDTWKTAEEIAENLRKICPEDPIKYDFALCHLGMSGECTHGKTKEPCKKCILAPCCIYGTKTEC